jgi:hypothetical protein
VTKVLNSWVVFDMPTEIMTMRPIAGSLVSAPVASRSAISSSARRRASASCAGGGFSAPNG